VEARLEVGGLDVTPAATQARSLLPGQWVSFEWNLFPLEARVYQGTAWFYLRFMPLEGGPATSRPISAQRLAVRAISVWGLSGPQARLVGAGSLLTGLVLSCGWMLRYVGRRSVYINLPFI
jgi:hypothetical protein